MTILRISTSMLIALMLVAFAILAILSSVTDPTLNAFKACVFFYVNLLAILYGVMSFVFGMILLFMRNGLIDGVISTRLIYALAATLPLASISIGEIPSTLIYFSFSALIVQGYLPIINGANHA